MIKQLKKTSESHLCHMLRTFNLTFNVFDVTCSTNFLVFSLIGVSPHFFYNMTET